MNFIEAVRFLNETGKCVTNKDGVILSGRKYSFGDKFYTHRGWHSKEYSITIKDILRSDWEIYKEELKLHTFEEAITALKEGKNIYRERLHITTYYKGKSDFLFSFGKKDMFANDWIIEEKL
jgi:hypothetical protein